MIKVMLKEPVTSGYDQNKQLVDKLGLFIIIRGALDAKLAQMMGAPGTRWYKGINNFGNAVLIPVDNIAYLEEVSGDESR